MKKMCVLYHKYLKRAVSISMMMVMILSTFIMSGCTTKKDTSSYQKNTKLDTSKEITIRITGAKKDFRELENVGTKFTAIYPNCNVTYEYLQNYDKNILTRLDTDEDKVDIFITPNIQEGSLYLSYAEDLMNHQDILDFSKCSSDLIENFKYVESSETTHLYSVPMGGEMRGLYVNKTLLSHFGLNVPETKQELLDACKVLSDAGYVPIQENPGNFGQRMMFPYIGHIIANSTEIKEKVANCDETAAEYFREPLEDLYNLTVENYYNYKYVETELKQFLDISYEGVSRDFLNVKGADGVYEKVDDLGNIAFMTGADSLKTTIDKVKEDYHSEIEYEFILAPVTENGGFAYMSPTNGLTVNKNTDHMDWTLEFMKFFFDEEMNKTFAEEYNIVPNTADAIQYISKKYEIPESQIATPAEVTFDYNFFNLINPVLIETVKANAQKYMDRDENGNPVMYDFSHYMDMLYKAFANQKTKLEGVK